MPIKAAFVGDVSDLQRSTQQAREEFRKVGTEAEGAARQLKAAGSSFDGTRLEGAALRAVRGVERVGGVTKLTSQELTKLERTVTAATDKFRVMGQEAPSSLQRVAKDIAHVRALEEDLARTTEQATAALKAQGQQAQAAAGFRSSALSAVGLGVIGGGAAGLAMSGISALTSQVKELAAAGTQLGPLRQSLEAMSGGSGQAAAALADLRVASRGLVGELGLVGAASRASVLGLDQLGVDFSELAGLSTRLGRAMGQDALTSIDDVTSGFGRQSSQVLDNLGVVVKADAAYAAMAETLGVSVDALSEHDKKVAWTTAALEAMREKAAALGEESLTLAEQWQRVTVMLTDGGGGLMASANASETLSTIVGALVDKTAELLSQSGELISLYAEITTGSEEAAEATEWLARTLASLVTWTPTLLIKGLEGVAAVFERIVAARQWMAGTLGDVDITLPGRDRTLLDPTAGQGRRAQSWLDEEIARQQQAYEKAQADALKKIAQGSTTAGTAAKALATELDKITGADRIKAAEALARNIDRVGGASQVGAHHVKAFADQFAAVADQSSLARQQLTALANTPAYRELFAASLKGPAPWNTLTASVPGADLTRAFSAPTRPTLANPALWNAPGMIGGISGAIDTTRAISDAVTRASGTTKDWTEEIDRTARAFAQLAQVAGGSLDGVTRQLGTAINAINAAHEMSSLIGGGTRGAAALASFGIGTSLGSLTSNRWLGGALGGGGGVATAVALGASGATLGISGAVGAASAIYSAQQNRRAQQAALAQQRQGIIASMGGIEAFRGAVERAGFEYAGFLRLFNSDTPSNFTVAVNQLNAALQHQESRAQALSKGLQEVARVQGVLSQQQRAQIVTTDPAGPGAEAVLAFAQQQRDQATAGIAQAIAAIDAATAGGTEHMADFEASIGATTASLVVLFDTALRQGESAITVLQRLAEPIQTLQRLLAAAGQTPGAGFGQLQVLTGIATGEQTGPLVSLAQGLGQALAGFANTGLLSPDLFAELANGIGEAYRQLELFGQGGLEAARLLQPSLQAIWQMIQDNPALADTLDETTRALLDFAEKSGLIGEDFRPAIDQMIDALEDLIATLREWIALVASMPGMPAPGAPGGEPPSAPAPPGSPGAPAGGGGDDLPRLAGGGIVTRPTRALIGEAGPEAVIPLSGWRGAQAATEQTVQVLLDGRLIAGTVVQQMPRLVRVYTGAA